MQTREYRNSKAGNCTPHFLNVEFCVFPCRTMTGIRMLMEKLQKCGIHLCLCLVSEHLWGGRAVTGMLQWAVQSWTSCACRLSDLFQTMSGCKKIIHGEIGSFLKTTALVLFETYLFFVGMIVLRLYCTCQSIKFSYFPLFCFCFLLVFQNVK